MKIMISDDHEIVREGLKQLLNCQEDMEVVGEAKDGRETLAKAKALRPDVLLLDVTMPRLNGLEAIGLIKEAVPDVRIVVFSMHKKEAYARQALAAGALWAMSSKLRPAARSWQPSGRHTPENIF